MERLSRDGVHKWPTPGTPTLSPILALVTTKAPVVDWHSRLGHRSVKILNHIVKSFNLPMLSSSTSLFAIKCKNNHSLSHLLQTLFL